VVVVSSNPPFQLVHQKFINSVDFHFKDNKAVRSAVNEFAEAYGRQVVITYEDGYWASWMMRK